MVTLCNMETKELLLNNIKEFIKEAETAKQNNSFNSSVTLYFKAIAVLTDLFVLTKKGFIPNNHKERFEILKKDYPEVYNILDKDFPLYQQSYRVKLSKEYMDVLENDFRKLVEFTKIKI